MVFLISWNVAGWARTCVAVRKNFSDSLQLYLNATKADIVALQEVKVAKKKLKEAPVLCGAGDKRGNIVEGWDSFWCHSESSKGFNGVATFAKTGLVLRADPAPFRDKELDDEGRCLVTYFSHFVLFNVYVVYSRQGERQDFKMKFLDGLRTAMKRVREETGLPVILCGDLNITYRVEDCHWAKRRIRLQALLDVPEDRWPSKECKMYSMACVTKFLHETDEGKKIMQNLPSSQREVESTIDHRESSNIEVVSNPNITFLKAFIEGGITEIWVDNLLRGSSKSQHNSCIYHTARLCGATCHCQSDVLWMRDQILGADKMVDSFLKSHPDAHMAYTCWDQSRNRRFDNEGTRIDYILLDESLAPSLIADSEPFHGADAIACFDDPISEFVGPLVVEGISRATAGGRYQPAPMDGSGMAELSTALASLQFEGLPRTGLFITPPQYSDHIGVCAVLDLQLLPRSVSTPNSQIQTNGGSKLDQVTLKCMYRPETPSIRSFFAAVKRQDSNVSNSQVSPASPAAPVLLREEAAPSEKKIRTESSEVEVVEL